MYIPRLPTSPKNIENVLEWIEVTRRELNTWAHDLFNTVPDSRLFGRVSTQVLSASFTIDPTSPFMAILSDSVVTSDVTIAVKAGKIGQWVVVSNIGSNNITVKNNALTKLGGAADVVLTPNSTLSLRWDGTNWLQTSSSIN